MKNPCFHYIIFKLGAIFALAVFHIASASDPSPLQDLCVAINDPVKMVLVNGKYCKDPKAVTSDDFFFPGLNVDTNINNTWGYNGTIANINTMPGLYTLGVSIGQNEYAPKGVNPPHTNPHGTEIIFVQERTLYVGFVSSDTNKNRLYAKIIENGDIFVFPKGTVHFQMNIGRTRAVAYVAWGSQNARLNVLPKALFESAPCVKPSALAKTFQVSEENIEYEQSQPWPEYADQ